MSAIEFSAIERLMGQAETLRGLRFLQPVTVHVEDARQIQAYVHAELEPEELETTRKVYVALGLLPPALDVQALLIRLLGEQVIGYYDARKKRLVVRDDVINALVRRERGTGAEEVLIHELVHALQDQHFALGERLDVQRSSDADSAFRALVEGDATLAMTGLGLQREGRHLSYVTEHPARVEKLGQLTATAPGEDPELERAPAIVRVPMLSAYTDGLVYTARLHGRRGWDGVNEAHRKPPASTEAILHSERPIPAPDPLALPDLGDVLSDDNYRLLKRDTLGELELRIFFERGGAPAAAERAAAGWDGDALQVYQRSPSGQLAAVWLTRWDTVADAREAQRAAEGVRAAEPAGMRRLTSVTRRGRRVLVLRGFERAERKALQARAL